MKKNFKKLVLNKRTLTNLESQKLVGGKPIQSRVVYNCPKTGPTVCNLSLCGQC